ncbi:hypothetical protein HK103_007362 [Boothiomyces macroporosus]|uniref:Uncharacterized protein n=1 Tax=Boothiomyces macroporosus TaxID=261099 RepID=A0AAD5UKX4_9FUNG|nr:hypothetical protein HK103_007362 [Boothiomyces macroporosus]
MKGFQYENLVQILTDSYAPAIVLPEAHIKIHYSTLRHLTQTLIKSPPFCNLKPGQVVSLHLPNSFDFITAFFATVSARAISNPIDISLSYNELQDHLYAVKPSIVITNEKSENYDMLKQICLEFKIPLYIITIDYPLIEFKKRKYHSTTSSVKTSLPVCRLKPTSTTDFEVVKSSVEPQLYSKSDIAVILHTNGSTGTPKLVPLAHENILISIKNSSGAFGLTAHDSAYNIMPLHHSHGLIGVLLTSFYAGSSVVLPLRFNKDTFWNDVNEYKVTWYSCTPFYHDTVAKNAPPKTKLRFVQSCGANFGKTKLLSLEKLLKVPVLTSYVMTETSHQICTTVPDRMRKLGSVGRPIGISVRIIQQGNVLKHGIGEICISGPTIFSKYWNEQENQLFYNINNTKWFRTGDLGWFDERGFLILIGRILDSVTINEKATPRVKIESILESHPSISQVILYGVSRQGKQPDVELAILLKKKETEEAIDQWIKSKLPGLKVARYHFVTELPKSWQGALHPKQSAKL